MVEGVKRRFQSLRTRAIALTAVFASASGVVAWGVMAEDSGFRPTAPAAIVAGLAVAATAWISPAGAIVLLVVAATLGGAAALLAIPAGKRCDPPVAEFVSHTFEDAAAAHVHDRCQLESDRRSIAGLVLAAGGGAAVVRLAQRTRVVRQRAHSGA